MLKKLFSKKAPAKVDENTNAQSSDLPSENTFQMAMQQHQMGNFAQAEALYRQILQHEPNHPDALHFLGVLSYQSGNYPVAIELINQALAVYPSIAMYSNLALIFQAQGDFEQLINTYQQALLLENNPAIHYNLANALAQQGNLTAAAASYQAALALNPDNFEIHKALGNLFVAQNKAEAAIAQYLQVLALKPDYVEVHTNLGLIFQSQGKLEQALDCFRNALKHEPNHAALHYQSGVVLQAQRKPALARESYQKALLINPDYADAHLKLGNVFQSLGQLDQAVASYEKALIVNPDSIEALNNLGVAFQSQLKFDEAMECFNRILVKNPDAANAYNNLGTIFQTQNKLEEAVQAFQRALVINPDFVDAYYNLGNSLQLQGNLDMAVDNYQKTLALKSDHCQAHNSLGQLLLKLGRFEKGWQHCEARAHPDIGERSTIPPNLPFPQWQGEPLKGKSLLIWYEQGLGDEIQFCRYVSVLKSQGAKHITWVCKKPLKPLLKTLKDVDKVITKEEIASIAFHDYWVFALSTPLYCHTTLDNIPASVPYLYANPEQQNKIASELHAIREFKVGICWKGNPSYKNDINRSPGIAAFRSLFEIRGVKFFTLQPSTREEFILNTGKSGVDRGHEINAASFEEAAALIMNLDLVITSCTSICHLAGALGKPVWIVLPWAADWRWLIEREDSPWYPNARLFRQTKAGDWHEVFQRVETELKQAIAANQKRD